MKQLVRFLACTFVAGLFASCTSFPEPNAGQDTLLVGKIVQTGKNYPTYGGASVNGTNTAGIVVTLRNSDTNERYQVSSIYGGFFSSVSLPPGHYELKSFYLKVQSGNYAADLLMNPTNHRKFTLVAGLVNNLGLIEWNGDAEEGMSYWLDKGYSEVASNFAERYPKSKWNSFEWRNLTITP